ncbi:adenine deaminase [Aquibaculum arenosum]|uniref:Adenine deaminase n=1 Tax=Aquibaculum arenosum TaxID=3032591 RepID=A0ABT5YP78_9PROT|nr:adenine deaminase [Fodinicurvata sp. CAU 1616]MDF2096765.1 adenine deaminase [Fodinicurvata sp. CAU 1616]
MTGYQEILARRIDQARGAAAADLVVKGGRYLDVARGVLETGDLAICGDTIVGVGPDYRGTCESDARGRIVVPGFIDTHVHVESSMVTPVEFGRCVLPRGTTTAICDPHEISNVLGAEGLEYFLQVAGKIPLDLFVQLSSCVPATHLETSGAALTAQELSRWRDHPRSLGLAEMMNFPGLLAKDPGVLDKLAAFEGRHIDGHAPMVSGRDLCAYAACGIRNCHESSSLAEAEEKLSRGLQVLLREGSVAKNLDTLIPLLTERTWPFLAFCTDDRNPLDIEREGHLDYLIRRAIALGAPALDVYRCVSWAAARHFGLADRGMVAPGQRADLVLLDDLETCAVSRVIAAGRPVDEALLAEDPGIAPVGYGSMKLAPVTAEAFDVPVGLPQPVIGIIPLSLVTERLDLALPERGGLRLPDPEQDVLRVAVVERHRHSGNIGRGFVKGFGFREGALAASVGHDSHNVTVIGASTRDMAVAVNRLIELGGGFVAVRDGKVLAELPLPVAGLMSDRPFAEVAAALKPLQAATQAMGCPLPDPFIQMAFLALPVIPHLKITDRGLVDVDRFELIAA